MPLPLTTNRLLGALPPAELAAIRPSLRSLTLKLHTPLYETGELIERIYFPLNSVLSVVTIMLDGSAVEIGTIGHEGLSGSQLIFGAERPASQMICQMEGEACWMDVQGFRRHLDTLAVFRQLVCRYTEAMFNFMGQSIACNRLHRVNERCARWLLLTQDRIGTDSFYLTQEFLAIMLGTNRPAVTVAASTLQEAGLIQYRRGRVTIKNREGLESAACECYSVTAANFRAALDTGRGLSPAG